MKRLNRVRGWVGAVVASAVAAFAAAPLPDERQASAQPPAKNELPGGLKYVPADAALFAYVDAAKVWDSNIVKSIRKSDTATLDALLQMAKKETGMTPEDVKSVVLFAPKVKPAEGETIAFAITFNKAYDKDKIQKAAETIFPNSAKPKVVAGDDRTAIVLLSLGDEYAKPQPADKTGPLSDALKAAASGKYAAVAGSTLANLPDELRGDEVPGPFRPFVPLFKAVSITATLDLGKDATLDVTVKTGTAGQAVDCEKSLGALVGLIQTELEKGLKDFDVLKDPELKDVVTLMKAGIESAKGAKYSTLGNETRLTVTLPGDLPFGSAYLAAKKKVQDAAAAATSSNNLKQIAIAMHSYADATGSMPPAAVCDKTGKPQLSWRVLILPYIEQDQLYKQFKLDEPWDSANNKKLIEKMPKVYAIPGKTKPGDTTTHYRVFVGNGAGYEWIQPPKWPGAFTDGTSNTIMCVTAADAVPWTKPDELEFDPNKDMTKLLGTVVNGRCQIAMFDGSVRSFNKIPAKKTLHAAITRAGGEVLEDFE